MKIGFTSEYCKGQSSNAGKKNLTWIKPIQCGINNYKHFYTGFKRHW